MAEPNPQPMARIQDADHVGYYRKLDCAYYEPCLNTAIVEGWDGFSCRQCKAYEPVGKVAFEVQAESIILTYALNKNGASK